MELANGELQESPESENEIKVQRVKPLYLDVASQALKNTYLHSSTKVGERAFRADRSRIPLFEASGLEEMIADAMGDAWVNPEFWANVSQKMESQEKGLWIKFSKAVQKFLADMKQKMMPLGSDKVITDIETAQESLAEVMALHLKSKMGNKKAKTEIEQLAPVFSERSRLDRVRQDYPILEITKSAFSENDSI